MSLGLLIAVLDDGGEHACIRSHYGGIEDELDILMLMRRYFDFLRVDIKGKLFNSIGSFLLGLELDRACYFVVVFYLDLLHDSLRVLRWNERAEVEQPLIHVEDVGFDHVLDAAGLLLILKDELLLEDGLKVLGVYSRDAGFSHKFVEDSVGLISWITILNIHCNLLLE